MQVMTAGQMCGPIVLWCVRKKTKQNHHDQVEIIDRIDRTNPPKHSENLKKYI